MHQRNPPSKASDEGDELVQVGSAHVAESSAEHDGHEPEDVLLPLDARVHLAAALEKTIFHDADGGEELQRTREQNSQRVQELHRLGEFARGIEVDDNDGLDFCAESEVRHHTSTAEQN